MSVFLCLYAAIAFVSIILISIDGYDFETTATAVLVWKYAADFQWLGPLGIFSIFSKFRKLILSFCMLAGRLEISDAYTFFTENMGARKLYKYFTQYKGIPNYGIPFYFI